ncbi:MAG TPA: TetR/AcrR family transcriptional regulator [Patescibacteria group bacterium]|nr:TetR/AcrR family transcriptional regulator [Patescibacteria group bacterium]
MARRSEHPVEELRRIAIKAGRDELHEKGLREFSARGAAARMGYTVGTLYHLFGDLDQFLLAVNADTLDRWLHDAVNVRPVKFDKRALGFLNSVLVFGREYKNLWSALTQHVPAEIPDWYREKCAALPDLLASYLAVHGYEGTDARRRAALLWAGVTGITSLALAGQADKPAKMIEDLYQAVMNA